jgi:ABC-type amino acid transport substrate-binding protein
MKGLLLVGLALGLVVLPGPLGAESLRFVVPEYAPFSGTVAGRAGGIGVDLSLKVLHEAGVTPSVEVVSNFSRCIAEVRAGTADGFFVGSRATDRDAVAILSDRILSNRWIWVWRTDAPVDPDSPEFRAKAEVGVILNSNPHTWLRERGYLITGTPPNVAGLLSMLEARRFDVLLVPELIFQEGLRSTGRSAAGYQSSLEVEQSMGIYVSKRTLSQHPDLLARINAAIKKLKL